MRSSIQEKSFLVTGGSGLCGHRLVEMLADYGAKRVISFDLALPLHPHQSSRNQAIHVVQGDIANVQLLTELCVGVDCVFHVAALVGPFYPRELYWKVNVQGTLNVIQACKENRVGKLVFSSTPSTRMDGNDILWKNEDELQICWGNFSHLYAETKAISEMKAREANCDELMTIAVAPHQVYGPWDGLFLPNLLHAAYTGRLRVFGNGQNNISMCHVDNYSYGMILGYEALYKGSPALGKYYVITDGPPVNFWRILDQAVVGMGYESLFDKFMLPKLLLLLIAYPLAFIAGLFGKQFKLNPFTVKMLTIHRTFNIERAEKDLGYVPLIPFEKGWPDTIQWFQSNKEWWMELARKTTRK
jgi:nucleoside-diphosphate-sugar epimerase